MGSHLYIYLFESLLLTVLSLLAYTVKKKDSTPLDFEKVISFFLINTLVLGLLDQYTPSLADGIRSGFGYSIAIILFDVLVLSRT